MSLKDKIIAFVVKRELKKKRWKPMMEKIQAIYGKIEGYKTYLMVAGIIVTEISALLGMIPPEDEQRLLVIFGAGAGATMADKINRVVKVLRQVKDFVGVSK